MSAGLLGSTSAKISAAAAVVYVAGATWFEYAYWRAHKEWRRATVRQRLSVGDDAVDSVALTDAEKGAWLALFGGVYKAGESEHPHWAGRAAKWLFWVGTLATLEKNNWKITP